MLRAALVAVTLTVIVQPPAGSGASAAYVIEPPRGAAPTSPAGQLPPTPAGFATVSPAGSVSVKVCVSAPAVPAALVLPSVIVSWLVAPLAIFAGAVAETLCADANQGVPSNSREHSSRGTANRGRGIIHRGVSHCRRNALRTELFAIASDLCLGRFRFIGR